MAWWEGQLKAKLRTMPPAEIERLVAEALQEVDLDRYLAIGRAMRQEARRRGLLKEGQPA